MQSKADLHFHTWYSVDSFTSPKSAVHAAIKRGIKVLAITDHDSIDGAIYAKKYAEENKLPIDIIIGDEIICNGGHIVALFLKEKVPSFMSLEETLKALKKQDALVIIPHMLFEEDVLGEYAYRYRVSYFDFVRHPEYLEMIDGIEIQNYTLIEPDFAPKAQFINDEFMKKARISSSDAHVLMNFGYSYTLFEGETAEDLRKAIIERTTIPVITKPSSLTNQIANWGPFIKFPVHLSLKFAYRTGMSIFSMGKEILLKLLPGHTKKTP